MTSSGRVPNTKWPRCSYPTTGPEGSDTVQRGWCCPSKPCGVKSGWLSTKMFQNLVKISTHAHRMGSWLHVSSIWFPATLLLTLLTTLTKVDKTYHKGLLRAFLRLCVHRKPQSYCLCLNKKEKSAQLLHTCTFDMQVLDCIDPQRGYLKKPSPENLCDKSPTKACPVKFKRPGFVEVRWHVFNTAWLLAPTQDTVQLIFTCKRTSSTLHHKKWWFHTCSWQAHVF